MIRKNVSLASWSTVQCALVPSPETKTKPIALPTRSGTGFRLANILAAPDLYLASVLLVLS